MSHKYRFISYAIILFLFGLTLIPVSSVFAEDSPEFVACQQIKPTGDFNLLFSYKKMKQKKNCFRDVARVLQDQSGNSMQPVAPTDPSGGEVAQLNARIAELESENARLVEPQGATADPPDYQLCRLLLIIEESAINRRDKTTYHSLIKWIRREGSFVNGFR